MPVVSAEWPEAGTSGHSLIYLQPDIAETTHKPGECDTSEVVPDLVPTVRAAASQLWTSPALAH